MLVGPAVHSQSSSVCLLGKGAVEFIFVQLILGTDHNRIATCQISVKEKTKTEHH